MLDGVLRHQARVVGSATRHDDDLVDLPEVRVAEPHLIEVEATIAPHTAAQRIGHGLRLLGDLLEHEQVVAALLRGGGIPGDRELLGLDDVAVEVGDDDLLAGDLHDLVLAELERVTRVGDEGGHVRGHEVLPLSAPHHER